MQPQVTDFIEKNKEYFLEELKKILRIPSVSAQSDKKPELLRCADAEAAKLKAIGLENVQLLKTKGNPLVYGDWLHAKGKPTFLIYGHYDVQPPDPLDQWKTPPFEPTVRDGNLYARGANDNKGQHFSHLCALEAYLKTVGKLPVNIKVLLEGEEEAGSVGLHDFAHTKNNILTCDAILVSDTPWLDSDHPALILSLKGLATFEIKLKTAAFDLHSGLFGGMVRNPCQALSWVLAKLKDENERILIPGWYDDVVELSAGDRQEIKDLPFDEQATAKEVGASALISEKSYTPLEANGGRPTLDINGIFGGYQGEGPKTIIPAEATAKLSMRLVAKQDPAKLEKLFIDYVESLCPKGCTVEVKSFHAAPALLVDKTNRFVQIVAKSYSEGFGKKVVFKREGASIPIMKTLEEVLKVPIIMIGIGLLDDAIHSPNEKMSLSNFYGGIRGAALAYEALAE